MIFYLLYPEKPGSTPMREWAVPIVDKIKLTNTSSSSTTPPHPQDKGTPGTIF